MNNSSYLDPNESLLNASGLLDQPQPSLATGNFKSSGWDPFGANGDASVIVSTAIKRSSDLKKKKRGDKKNKAIALAERGYKRHMAQLEADKKRDRNLRMARHVYRRMESRERLMTRQRERLSLQQYCSQPLLYIMDPAVELKVTKPISIGQALESRSGSYSQRNNARRVHPATLDTMRKADLRAANEILSRFVSDEEHDKLEKARRRYKKSLKRGELSMKAQRTRELEERLGTPFAKSRLRRTRKLNKSLDAKRCQTAAPLGSNTRAQMLSMQASDNHSKSMGPLKQATETPLQRRQQKPPSTAPSHLLNPQTNAPMVTSKSEAALHGSQSFDKSQMGAVSASGSMYTTMEGASMKDSLASLGHTGTSMSHSRHRHDPQAHLPVWQRTPIAHHELPERSGSWQLRRLIESTEGRWSKKKARRGFATKMIYPTEVAGLNTLFS